MIIEEMERDTDRRIERREDEEVEEGDKKRKFQLNFKWSNATVPFLFIVFPVIPK